MVAIHHRGVEIDLCTGCGGVWLDRGELERILKARPASNARLDISTVDALDAAHLGVELTAQL
ncbi:MAG: zf-TFIIB domain-containing protein, partial [Limisphaerales bacterium]